MNLKRKLVSIVILLYFILLNLKGQQLTNSYFVFDSTGIQYRSSLDGLQRYNGREIYSFKSSIHGMADNFCQGDLYIENHSVWLCGYTALQKLDLKENHFKTFILKNSDGSECYADYFFIGSIEKYRILVKIGNELVIFNTKHSTQEKNFLLPFGEFNKFNYCQLQDSNYILTTTYNQNSKILLLDNLSLIRIDSLSYAVSCITALSKSTVLFGTETGDIIYYNLTSRELISKSKISTRRILDIAKSGLNEVLCTTHDNILKVDLRQLQTSDTIQILNAQGQAMKSLFKPHLDKDSLLWICSDGKGVFVQNLNKKKFVI